MSVSRADIEAFISDNRGLPPLEAVVATLGRLLHQHGPFDMPRYQRPYCWKAAPHWRNFLSDLSALAFAEAGDWRKTNNYLGSIVISRSEACSAGRLGLLDGQQRLLTACVVLKALGLLAEQAGLTRERAVIDALLRTEDGAPTIQPGHANAQDFLAVLNQSPAGIAAPAAPALAAGAAESPDAGDPGGDGPGEEDLDEEELGDEEHGEDDRAVDETERLQAALAFFHARLARAIEARPDPAEAIRALMRALLAHTRLVVIRLAPQDDGLEIFDRINSRAELLSLLDRLKVVLLEAVRRAHEAAAHETTSDTVLYQEHWRAVFESPERVDFWDEPASRFKDRRQHQDWLLRDFLSARRGARVDGARALIEVRQLLADTAAGQETPQAETSLAETPLAETPLSDAPDAGRRGAQAETLLRALCSAGTAYARINGAPPLDRHAQQIERIRQFSRHAVEPLLVTLQMTRAEDEAALVPILDMLESFTVRRFFSKQGSVNDYELYARLCAVVDQRADATGAALAAAVHRRLAGLGRKDRYWTDDDRFRKDAIHRPLVDRKATPQAKERKQLFKQVFALLDAHAQGARNPTPALSDPRFTIEHLFPLNGHADWPRLSQAESDWLVRIGNLTMVDSELNRRMGDQAWPIKRALIDAGCSIHLNRRLVETEAWAESWTPRQIRERGRMLADLAATRWPGPDSPDWPRS